MIRRQHVPSRTAREYYRAGAPEPMPRTPTSSTPREAIHPASFPRFLLYLFRETICVRVGGFSPVFWALPRTYGPVLGPLEGFYPIFGPKPLRITGLPLGQPVSFSLLYKEERREYRVWFFGMKKRETII